VLVKNVNTYPGKLGITEQENNECVDPIAKTLGDKWVVLQMVSLDNAA